MKKVLLPLVMCVMFLSGCGPSFSVDDGTRAIHRIMVRNEWSFSEDGDKTFCISSVSFQNNNGDERKYVVVFWGRENGNLYKYSYPAWVGKDEGGWYVQMKSPRSESLKKYRE